MSYISPEQLKEIQNNSDIVNYIGQFVKLKKTGSDYLGLCPFHDENTPSFHVSQTKQVFHCFGCGKSGNIFQFASQYEHLSFVEAVKHVAKYFNQNLSIENKQVTNNPVVSHRKKIYEMYQKASEFYNHILLHTSQGEQALSYLQQRGITEDDIKTFGLGFAPISNNGDVLVSIFKDDQIEEQLYDDSGLFIMDYKGVPHDRFKERIMFPIRDEVGQVVAFSGRRLSDDIDEPKYINSPETPIFNKSQILFNLDLAKNEIKAKDQAILFEGYFDVISAYKAGIKNGIASMGTSFTNQQIQKVKHFTNNLLICYDGDEAGLSASNQLRIHLQNDKDLDISILTLPDHKDPDEYIKTNGEEVFYNLVNNGAISSIKFAINYLKRDFNLAKNNDKMEYIDLILNEINSIDSKLEQNLYIQELSEEVRVNEDLLIEQLAQKNKQIISSKKTTTQDFVYNDNKESVAYKPKVKKLSLQQIAEYSLLYRAFFEKKVRDILKDKQFVFPSITCEEIYLLLDDYMEWHEEFDIQNFENILKTNDQQQVYSEIINLTLSDYSTAKEITDYIAVIEEEELKKDLNQKYLELKEANKMGNIALEKELSNEIMDILKKINNRRNMNG